LLKLLLEVVQSLVCATSACRRQLFSLGVQEVLLGIIQNHKEITHHQTQSSGEPPSKSQHRLNKEHQMNGQILNVFALWLSHEKSEDGSQIEAFIAQKRTLE